MGAEQASAIVVSGSRVRNILVIVNPKAGGLRRDPAISTELRRLVRSRGEVVVTRHTDEALEAIARARLLGCDAIASCGGDGTGLSITSAIASVYRGAVWPRLAILPCGTLNTVAYNLGYQHSAVQFLAGLLASEEPASQSHPLLRVNDSVGFIFGSGMVARVVDAFNALGKSMLTELTVAARVVVSAALRTPFARGIFHPESTTVSIDGQDAGTFPITALMASVVISPAARIRALHRAGEDGGFHVVGTDQPPSRIVREVGRIWVGLPSRVMAIDAVARRAVLGFEAPAPYIVDGELFTASRIELAVTQPIELIGPATR